MTWGEVFVALTLPAGLGLLAAWPLWRWKQFIVGNAVGAGIAFVLTIGLIGLSYVTQQRENEQCAAGLIHCVSRVDAHMPFLLYALIGIVDACAIFWLGLIVEERQAPKTWQSAPADEGP
jgi:hypothetical protein